MDINMLQGWKLLLCLHSSHFKSADMALFEAPPETTVVPESVPDCKMIVETHA